MMHSDFQEVKVVDFIRRWKQATTYRIVMPKAAAKVGEICRANLQRNLPNADNKLMLWQGKFGRLADLELTREC
jgi:hypothetical protein